MVVQNHHDFTHQLLISPGLGDAIGADLTDARHLPQPLGRLLNHLKHRHPDDGHEFVGVNRADATAHSGAQVLLDPFGAGDRFDRARQSFAVDR